MLRMNRKWMAHIRATFPDINEDMMGLLRASHDALQVEPALVPVQRAPLDMRAPLEMLVEDDPHWPPNEQLDEEHARVIEQMQ